jgi:hypothetical protein
VQDIDVAELRRVLKEQGMIDVYDPETAPGVPRLRQTRLSRPSALRG